MDLRHEQKLRKCMADVIGPRRLMLLLLILFQFAASPASAQATAAPGAPPPQVQELLRLLEDSVTRAWLDQQKRPASSPGSGTPQGSEDMGAAIMATRIQALREHLASLVVAVLRLPYELQAAARQVLTLVKGHSPEEGS